MMRTLKIRTNFKHLTEDFLASVNTKEKGNIGRQRVAVFIYSSVLLITGVVLNLCGVAGPVSPFFQLANSLQGGCAILLLYLYYNHRISLTTAMSLFCIILQTEISAETIYCAIHQSSYEIALIIAKMSLSSIILLLSIITYLCIIPYVIAILSLSTFALSIYLTDSDILANFFMIFFIIFTVLTLLGRTMTRNISRLEQENLEQKDEPQEVLDVFRMSKDQMRSYMTLAREKKLAPEQTAEILTSVGSVAERRIRDNVAHYIRQSSLEFDRLRDRLPELSPSELEICSLILKEKKLKEISELLGKSCSNITCQRTNIRTKLGLQKEDNLQEVLKKRMRIKDKKSI